ncbi:MAG: nucleoside triphosphate pyrophosphohydrolase [Gammaproteobacteria bacterium]|nr:nucleoside triphosphate pyrophosphohydrolase [Gammaproteobacteria bacterium]
MNLQKLREIVARLRDPETGCPWDRRQDFKSIANYTLEEVYETIDAINREDFDELKDELGDLLLQVVFHAQIAAERGLFDLTDVEASICEKMLRRHPHVFGEPDQRTQSEAQIKESWETEKVRERAEKDCHGVLDGVPQTFPALKRAQKLQKRAANVGFDWKKSTDVLDKIQEEITELEQAVAQRNVDQITEEMGDLLFSCVNLARHLKVDAESALMTANRKFEARFRRLESELASQARKPQDCSLAELDAVWSKIKRG